MYRKVYIQSEALSSLPGTVPLYFLNLPCSDHIWTIERYRRQNQIRGSRQKENMAYSPLLQNQKLEKLAQRIQKGTLKRGNGNESFSCLDVKCERSCKSPKGRNKPISSPLWKRVSILHELCRPISSALWTPTMPANKTENRNKMRINFFSDDALEQIYKNQSLWQPISG